MFGSWLMAFKWGDWTLISHCLYHGIPLIACQKHLHPRCCELTQPSDYTSWFLNRIIWQHCTDLSATPNRTIISSDLQNFHCSSTTRMNPRRTLVKYDAVSPLILLDHLEWLSSTYSTEKYTWRISQKNRVCTIYRKPQFPASICADGDDLQKQVADHPESELGTLDRQDPLQHCSDWANRR